MKYTTILFLFVFCVFLYTPRAAAHGGHGGHGGGHGHGGHASGGHSGGFGHGGAHGYGHRGHSGGLGHGGHPYYSTTGHTAAHTDISFGYGNHTPFGKACVHTRWVYCNHLVPSFYFDPYANYYNIMHAPRYSNIDKRPYGYVVYNNDTIAGRIAFFPGLITISQSIDSTHNYDYRFKISAAELGCVTAFIDDGQLCAVKLHPADDKLWRIVHEGKLNIYDGRLKSLYEAADVDKGEIMVAYEGQIKPVCSFLTVNNKIKLTAIVNEVYSLNLDPKKYSWQQLLLYVDKLN